MSSNLVCCRTFSVLDLIRHPFPAGMMPRSRPSASPALRKPAIHVSNIRLVSLYRQNELFNCTTASQAGVQEPICLESFAFRLLESSHQVGSMAMPLQRLQ
jgi:hypothetical protein